MELARGDLTNHLISMFKTVECLSLAELKSSLCRQFGVHSYTSTISQSVQKRKLRRFRALDGNVYVYRPGFKLPEGAVDYGFSKLREQNKDRVPSAKNAAQLLLTIQYGKNSSLTLDMNQARQIYEQLTPLFS